MNIGDVRINSHVKNQTQIRNCQTKHLNLSVAQTTLGGNALRSFVFLLAIFAFHRLLSFPYLKAGFERQSVSDVTAYFVGLLSDLWIAGIGSVLVIIFDVWQRIFSQTPSHRSWLPLCVLVLIFIMIHQNYVSFFHHQFVSNHFSYISDIAFLRTLGVSDMTPGALVIAASSSLLLLLLKKWLAVDKWSPRTHGAILLGLPVFAITAHVVNIRYRVNLFLPPTLQMNILEKLPGELVFNPSVTPLSDAEISWLKNTLHAQSSLEADTLKEFIRPRAENYALDEAGKNLVESFQRRITAGRKPVVLVVLMESFRPAETGIVSVQKLKKTITPQIDALAKDGVIFRHAFSTGTVTRAGQEAVWCGFLGGRGISMMRERPDLRESCVPDFLKNANDQSGKAKGGSFWFHGGDADFDSQVSFWSRHGVEKFLSRKDFPTESPSTNWGVSDVVMFQRAIEEIENLRTSTTADFLSGMILTLTHHVPWMLPVDAPQWIRQLPLNDPSHFTAAYADYALGSFVTAAQTKDLWKDLLMVVVSDHGTNEQPYNPVPTDTPEARAFLASNIALVLSGGIVEEEVASLALGFRDRQETVSQAEVAPFLAKILSLDNGRFFTSPLFALKRNVPTISNLGESVFLPQENLLFSMERALTMPLDITSSIKQTFALTYYRAFQTYINTPNSGMSHAASEP